MNPGHTATGRTPVPASSIAKLSVKTVAQALAAEYVPPVIQPHLLFLVRGGVQEPTLDSEPGVVHQDVDLIIVQPLRHTLDVRPLGQVGDHDVGIDAVESAHLLGKRVEPGSISAHQNEVVSLAG